MSPVNQNLETVSTEHGDHHSTDMRRVSMALAFSPARQRRRRGSSSASWFRHKLGLASRRVSRGY